MHSRNTKDPLVLIFRLCRNTVTNMVYSRQLSLILGLLVRIPFGSIFSRQLNILSFYFLSLILPHNLPLIKFWIGLISFGSIWKIKEYSLISCI